MPDSWAMDGESPAAAIADAEESAIVADTTADAERLNTEDLCIPTMS